MTRGTNPDCTEMFAAAMAWWRDAGLTSALDDDPHVWLAPDEPAKTPGASAPRQIKPVMPAVAPAIAEEPTPLPDNLKAFQAWWMTARELDGGRCVGRVPPRGVASPDVMIIACEPEAEDRERLLSGPEGRMIASFLKAGGISDDQVYVASALPCHSPGTEWSAISQGAIAAALRHHVALVAPKRIIAIGGVILPLLGHGSPQAAAVSLSFNHQDATIPLLGLRRIPAPQAQARWKALVWRAWLDWTA